MVDVRLPTAPHGYGHKAQPGKLTIGTGPHVGHCLNPMLVMADFPQNRKNAELIVARLSAHDDLVAALRGFLDAGMSIRHDSVIWSEARAALSKAGVQ